MPKRYDQACPVAKALELVGDRWTLLSVRGSRHVHPEAVLVHTDCGHPVQMGYYCAHCNDRVRGVAVQHQQI